MARNESVALGGYFKTPTELLKPIAGLVSVGPGKSYSLVDPCAGDGEAVYGVRDLLGLKHETSVYTCEMEATRHETLRWNHGYRASDVHGDALRLTWSVADKAGASLLYLNPPYDFDREHKRLEERFLIRFAPCLSDRGVLIFIVPVHALAASADTIGRNFINLRCYLFPEDDSYRFSRDQVFRQCVLVGSKRPTLAEPDPTVRAQVQAWNDGEPLKILGSERSVIEMPGHDAYKTGFSEWRVAPLDVRGLLSRMALWHSTDRAGCTRPVPGVVPNDGDLLARKYPLAVPPKPAHLAAAIASGVFNGAEVTAEGMPRLRVKGVFDRDSVKVEDKVNQKGEKTAEVRVQQPKLVVTVLDTAQGTYHTLRSSAESTGSRDPACMSTGDLLTKYGQALMTVMREQCPVLHDPAADGDRFDMPRLARSLFRAQEESVRAAVKLLGGAPVKLPSTGAKRMRALRARTRSRARLAAYILGEIGSGKSSCALAVAEVLRARKVLIMCPPHLLDSWRDQAAAVVPWRRVTYLQSVADVDAWIESTDHSIAVLSREAAKLGHSYEGITGACPRCGAAVADDHEELARKRVRCSAVQSRPVSPLARAAHAMALALMPIIPAAPEVNQLLRGRMRDRMMRLAYQRGHTAKQWADAQAKLVRIARRVAKRLLAGQQVADVLTGILCAINDDNVTKSLVERVYVSTMFDVDNHGAGASARTWARDALLLVREPDELAEKLKALGLHTNVSPAYHSFDTWGAWSERSKAIASGLNDPESYRTNVTHGIAGKQWQKHTAGTPKCAVEALAKLSAFGGWHNSEPCGEPLYQAVPEPRRVALAKYLVKRCKPDLFISDEAHESANANSAQSIAAHRIVGTGVPTIALTGSVMNGYAVSLFANQWALDTEFRKEFGRGDLTAFNRRYGYIKELVTQEDTKSGKVIEWGSQSDRRETTKEIGNAPGVLPLFVLRYLLRMAVTLHKSDLALDLPGNHEIVEWVEADPPVMAQYKRMLDALKAQIKTDRFDPELAGKLFGQLSEIGSYLDRATRDTGNREDGSYAVAYPVSDELGDFSGRVIASAEGLPAETVLAKERRMLEVCEREFSEGRRMMIFGWHEAGLPRLQRLVEKELGVSCALLTSKVQAKKRQDWIDKNAIGKKVHAAVMNPACVKTGLNNLVYFHSQWWHENPAVDPQTYRQAVGRVDRIGKTTHTRIYFPVYEGTAQALAHRLLMHKVGVSLATDGLDAESALQAAGVGSTETLDAFSVGRALFEMMERGEEMVRARAPEVAEPKPANDLAVPQARPAKPKQLDLFGMFDGKKVA